MTELLYFDNPLIFDFTATVLDVIPQEEKLSHVVLDKTYFYPTGGGQAHDIGRIDGQAVVDVRKINGSVIHVVKGNITTGNVHAQVDKNRRLRNMQAHSGQHLLSAAFLHVLEAETVAVKMSPDAASTVDISLGELTTDQIEAVETVANQVIMENRSVKSYFLAPNDPKLDVLRRAVKFDKVDGDVRIVEIDDWDMSACAGTHVPSTGMLGLLKILKVENYKGGSRVHFLVGIAALEQFRHVQQVASDVSNLLSASTNDVVNLVQKLQAERQILSKQVAEFQAVLLQNEKVELLDTAVAVEHIRLVKAEFDNKPNDALKTLGHLLGGESETVGVFVNRQGANVGVVVCASADSGVHAGNLLKAILADFDGRGGGGEPYAQGICKGLSDTATLLASIDPKVRETLIE
ncbi:MAG: DHHA1 domain-containing protein [Anaerolineae bacterium]|nr:DHHA1 domain-containing protein [Anaerolineae bacterium]MDQ7035336.1 DHHA1 domain-containing protein [Anaerolineae bacterium]